MEFEASTIVFLLMLGGALLLVVEMFVPGMILGCVGVGLLAAASIYSFVHFGLKIGLTVLTFEILVLLCGVFLWMKYWPKSRLGSKMMLGEVSGVSNGALQDQPKPGDLGQALTVCRPAGTVEIEGRRYDALTSGEFIEIGSKIQVIRVDGSGVWVRSAV